MKFNFSGRNAGGQTERSETKVDQQGPKMQGNEKKQTQKNGYISELNQPFIEHEDNPLHHYFMFPFGNSTAWKCTTFPTAYQQNLGGGLRQGREQNSLLFQEKNDPYYTFQSGR